MKNSQFPCLKVIQISKYRGVIFVCLGNVRMYKSSHVWSGIQIVWDDRCSNPQKLWWHTKWKTSWIFSKRISQILGNRRRIIIINKKKRKNCEKSQCFYGFFANICVTFAILTTNTMTLHCTITWIIWIAAICFASTCLIYHGGEISSLVL